jgi:hypothetical protein
MHCFDTVGVVAAYFVAAGCDMVCCCKAALPDEVILALFGSCFA